MDITQFKFRFDLQMRWNDLDALGHVNNAVFITYFEAARGRFMLEACPGWDWHKNMFLIAQVHADFQKELLLSAKNPQVLMRTSKIGTKSFELSYALISEGKDRTILHATGTTTQIMFDMKTRQTIVIPDWVKKGLIAFDA